MVNYPNIPGTFITQVTTTPEAVPVGAKRACIIGETDIAFHGAPYENTPVFVTSIEQAQAIYGVGGSALTEESGNFLLNAVIDHFREGGGSCWVIKCGPTGTFVSQGDDGAPAAVVVGECTTPGSGTFMTGDKIHLRVAEYVTNSLVNKGLSFASDDYMYTFVADTKNLTVTRTIAGDSDGFYLYAQMDGSNQWYLAGDDATDVTISGPDALVTEIDLPIRREDLLLQDAATVSDSITGDDTGKWNMAISQSDALYDIDFVCCARGHATRKGTTDSNIALMSAAALHAEQCFDDQYKKRMAIVPANWTGTVYEVAADMKSADYTVDDKHFSDRLIKVSRNGMEGVVCGLLCNRNYYESPTFGALNEASVDDLGIPYPFTKVEQDQLIGLGWLMLKPYAGVVRIMRGVTGEMGNDEAGHPTIFKDISLRANIDHHIESIQGIGDSFLGSGTAKASGAGRTELNLMISDYLNREKDVGSIESYTVSVSQAVDSGGNELRNRFTVSLNLTPIYEVNAIDVQITIGS